MFDRIETEHLVLRKARMDDLHNIWKNIWSDKTIADNMLWKTSNTLKEAEEKLIMVINYQEKNFAYFVCMKDTDEAIGFAGINETEEGVFEESGIAVSRKCQGLGYGKEILSALVDLAFYELNGNKFYYECFHENTKSANLCKSLGFAYVSSTEEIRKWDGYKYTSDRYVLNKTQK